MTAEYPMLRRRLQSYEDRYGFPSTDIQERLRQRELAMTPDVTAWLLLFRAQQRLEKIAENT